MRLTEKVGKVYRLKEYSIPAGTGMFCVDKLGQLEDIEDELGIDLIIYFSALKNGVYYYSHSQLTKDVVYPISNFLTDYNDKLSYSFMTKFEKQLLHFEDYGKTWALTREELL